MTFRRAMQRAITYTGLVGITGQHALTEQAQKLIHKHITDSPEPKGWDNQIGTSLGLLASVKDRRALRSVPIGTNGWSINSAGYWQAVAGNVMTYAGHGSLVFVATKSTAPAR